MRLTVLLPMEILLDEEVRKITAEAENGHFCLLPRHADFVAALVPGLLSFIDQAGEEQFLALNEGILVKCGADVSIATGNAARGHNLAEMQQIVENQFALLNEREKSARSAVARLEASFVRGILEERG